MVSPYVNAHGALDDQVLQMICCKYRRHDDEAFEPRVLVFRHRHVGGQWGVGGKVVCSFA
jgi:hypothetical protein